ncbi:MAG: 3-oxoacyl-[acyl-carrier-protein] synthase 3 [Chloroflexota bacterium]|jgi:3-oxoacyl-[acyl-carrier-protein] synthase-3|nr:MAG: 3-oxoacyl-[acyl-carrier-protein] synthase 3 [Chloroflexota bacterium]
MDAHNGQKIYAHIVGWGMAVPDSVLTNAHLEAIVETSDEWIRTRTGIRERRIASERDSTTSLGLKAAQRALDVADMQPTEIDLIIVATSTPENIFPSTASLIQHSLGAVKAGAFDLSAACSGFVYGVDMAAQSIKSGSIQSALVIGTETMTRILDWQDRGTCILFGDGAGAVVLRASTVEGGILSAVLRSDGSGSDMLGLPTVGSVDLRNAYSAVNGARPTTGLIAPELSPSLAGQMRLYKMHMNGGEVFKFATRVINESVHQALEKAGLTINDVSLIVPHQANQRIIQAAARALKVDTDLFMSNLDRYGNTSAASIPIALCEAIEQGRVSEGQNVVFVGFGGGLTWASMVVKWTGARPPEPGATTLINQQRRQISYLFARWQMRLRRFSRRWMGLFTRFLPRRGKNGE